MCSIQKPSVVCVPQEWFSIQSIFEWEQWIKHILCFPRNLIWSSSGESIIFSTILAKQAGRKFVWKLVYMKKNVIALTKSHSTSCLFHVRLKKLHHKYVIFFIKIHSLCFQYQKEGESRLFSSEVILQFFLSSTQDRQKYFCAIFLERMTLISTVLFQIQL